MALTFPYHETHSDLRRAVRALCAKFPLDYWDRHDLDHEFPEDFHRAFAEAGYFGVLVPEEFGGDGGSMGQMAAILEEVSASGGALNAASAVHIPILAIPTLLAFGSDEQRQTILPRIASGEVYVTFGVTEPNAGSDTTQIETTATRVDGGWRINGSKVWNSGALRGDLVMLLARTSPVNSEPKRGLGLTLFLLDLRAGGVKIQPIPKIARNAVASAEVFFSDVFVEDADVVGQVGEGFYHLLHSLNGERILVSAEALGIARWAINAASKYAQERVVFGHPIGRHQSVQHPLAKAYLQVLAATELMGRAVEVYEKEGGRAVGVLANGLKYLASEAEFAATDAAMQTFGGYAFAREFHIGRHWMEARLQRIAPLNNEMILNFISESALSLPRSY